MTALAHPGPASPAPPGVRLEVPDAWEAVPSGAALLRARAAGSRGDTVEVTVRQHVAATGLGSEALVATLAADAGPGGAEVEDPFVVELEGREWHARNVSWDEGDTPVVEVHLATTVADADPVSTHVVAVGRVRGAGLDDDYDLLQTVLETLVVEGAP
ncbi:hypothetical protein JQN72_04550 [Phycicoccus sp. CSK15P-2]|uniref:hypothetical protein n=1 Tax=Phycicoccus sp. CSK15P-2 TaxID=2807627 RepID=UPI00194EF987|nr:hypothetical protein [Phycicoccus sp. CSK15P-2]MBM6403512.1 hypothetical protein [Phycicoccus sp. CSK15P-2]